MSFSLCDVFSRSIWPRNQSAAAADERATTQLLNSSAGVRLGDVMASPMCRCGRKAMGAVADRLSWKESKSRAPGLSSKHRGCGGFRETEHGMPRLLQSAACPAVLDG